MKKSYWLWKYPKQALSGEKIEWIHIHYEEFERFLQSPDSENRYFIDFDSYKIEAPKDEYLR